LTAVAADMGASSTQYQAYSLIDAPLGTTLAVALAGRGPSGVINFNTSNKRVIPCWPWLKSYDPATDSVINKPYSQFLAGVIAATDLAEGYWVSPSNHQINGIVGTEVPVSSAINDASTDANTLNAAGITTVFNSFGTGLRVWGNRSAAFPSNTAPVNFIPVGRTADIINESVQLAMLPFVDKPITNGTIDSIRETVNAFLRTLIARGALVDGVCTYDPSLNPPTQVAAGQLVFSLNIMPPTPAERITFNTFIDVSLLKSLGQTNA